MFKKITALTGLMILTSTYQNCSPPVNFASDVEMASITPEPPVCRPMTAAEVKPSLLYAWNHSKDQAPNYSKVMASPVVGDLNGDGIPEIVFVSYKNDDYTSEGVLRVIDGASGQPLYSVTDSNLMPYASATPLIIDIDGDGKAEIFYIHYSQRKVIALNYNGSFRWEYAIDHLPDCRYGFSAASLFGQGRTEIIAGSYILAEDSGRRPFLVARTKEPGMECASYAASLSTTPNSSHRVIGSTGVFDNAGNYIWRYIRSGYPATADVRPDVPGVEVVVTGSGYLTIYNGLTGQVLSDKKLSEHQELICQRDGSGNPLVGGGQASIGDFDGDPSSLEIAIATGKSLMIFNSRGEKVAGSTTQDCSSMSTGLTSFDFNGDGKPEIIYADEQYLRIYELVAGQLKVIWSTVNPSATLREYPVVADVNGDGYAELVVVANSNSVYPTQQERDLASTISGLRVFKPSTVGSWMPTRPIWNQHSYYSTNVNNNLTATATSMPNSSSAKFFKRNAQLGSSSTELCSQ